MSHITPLFTFDKSTQRPPLTFVKLWGEGWRYIPQSRLIYAFNETTFALAATTSNTNGHPVGAHGVDVDVPKAHVTCPCLMRGVAASTAAIIVKLVSRTNCTYTEMTCVLADTIQQNATTMQPTSLYPMGVCAAC